MRLALYGKTALSVLMTLPSIDRDRAVAQEALDGCQPTAQALRYVRRRYPQLPDPLHLLAPRWERALGAAATLHSARAPLPAGSLLKIHSGIYVPSPELCLAQLARESTDQELILYGGLLCGSFAIDPICATGLRERAPLTDVATIARFARLHPGIKGLKALRRCLPHMTELAASPPEVFLRMALCLPHRLGGFGCEGALINHAIPLGKRGQNLAGRSSLVPDLYWPGCRLDVEYDADSVHLTSHQAMLDATKRLALEAEGYRVITVTSLQLGSSRHMANVAREVSRCAKQPMRIRSKRFPKSHRSLFALDWSLRTLFKTPDQYESSRDAGKPGKSTAPRPDREY